MHVRWLEVFNPRQLRRNWLLAAAAVFFFALVMQFWLYRQDPLPSIGICGMCASLACIGAFSYTDTRRPNRRVPGAGRLAAARAMAGILLLAALAATSLVFSEVLHRPDLVRQLRYLTLSFACACVVVWLAQFAVRSRRSAAE